MVHSLQLHTLLRFYIKLHNSICLLCVSRHCSLSTLTLREHGISTGVGPHVPLQFVGVSAGIAAQAALERALPSVRADVAFQFANLEAKSKTEVSTDEQARLPKAQETSQPIYLGTKPNKHISVPFSHCTQPLAPAHSTSPPSFTLSCLMLAPTLNEAFTLCDHLTVIDHPSI